MNTKLDMIESLAVNVNRDDKEFSERLHIEVTISTYFSNSEIREFSKEDLYNLNVTGNLEGRIDLLKFNVYLVTSLDAIKLEKPVEVKRTFHLTNKKNASFVFNDSSILVTDVILISTINPTGTKRTVITYEDTDVIDEGKY